MGNVLGIWFEFMRIDALLHALKLFSEEAA